MSINGDPDVISPAFPDEDVIIVITVAGSGSIAGWTIGVRLWAPDGTEIEDGGIAGTVTDGENREVTASFTGMTLVPGRHKWEVRRLDAGGRVVIAWGYLPIREIR